MSRVLRVVERRRSGERLGRSPSGPLLLTWPPWWSGRSGGLTEGCLAVALHRGGEVTRDTQRENDDTSHGVFSPSAKPTRVIVVPVYLADTVRPQSFSLSRRLDPTRASWLCFAPHPPVGFRPSELFPLSQPRHLSVPVALLPLGWPQLLRAVAPSLHCFVRLASSPSGDPVRLLLRRQKSTDDIIRIEGVGKPPERHDERSQQPLERSARALAKAPLGSAVGPVEAGSSRREPRLQSLAPAESPFPVRGR